MLLSEMSGKEIVNLRDGAKLGLVGESDIKITVNGKIDALVVSSLRSGAGRFFSRNNDREGELIVPWKAIKKIGSEVIIVDIDYAEIG